MHKYLVVRKRTVRNTYAHKCTYTCTFERTYIGIRYVLALQLYLRYARICAGTGIFTRAYGGAHVKHKL